MIPTKQADRTAVPPIVLLGAILVAAIFMSTLQFHLRPLATVIRTFFVGIHEIGHAIGCIATGGRVHGMLVLPHGNADGLTWGGGGIHWLWTQTGYLGVSAFGCFMLWMTAFPQRAGKVLCGVGIAYALAGALFMGAPHGHSQVTGLGIMSMLVAFGFGVVLCLAGAKLPGRYAYATLCAIAVLGVVSAELDIIGLLDFSGLMLGESVNDAQSMQNQTGIPSSVWALLWLALTNLGLIGVLLDLQRRWSRANPIA